MKSVIERIINRIVFQLWYLRNPPWDTGITPPELLDHLHHNSIGRALDCGCGTGTNAITLSKLGWDVDAIDFVPQAIRIARKKALNESQKINFIMGSVLDPSKLNPKYDLIYDIGCFHNLSAHERSAFIETLPSLLNIGGYYLLYAHLTSNNRVNRHITDRDIEKLGRYLELTDRKDSFDSKERKTVWLTFKKNTTKVFADIN